MAESKVILHPDPIQVMIGVLNPTSNKLDT